MTTPYDPPVNDPREEGVKHWDKIRSELMLTRDQLKASDLDCEAKARQIDQLKKDYADLQHLRELDRNECVALKTSLHIIGRLVLSVLNRGSETRRNGDAYAPQAGGVVDGDSIEAVAKSIEDLLAGKKTPIPEQAPLITQ